MDPLSFAWRKTLAVKRKKGSSDRSERLKTMYNHSTFSWTMLTIIIWPTHLIVHRIQEHKFKTKEKKYRTLYTSLRRKAVEVIVITNDHTVRIPNSSSQTGAELKSHQQINFKIAEPTKHFTRITSQIN